MKILSMDTSNQALSVALVDGLSLIAEFTLTVRKNHSISLMPTIDFMVKSAGWTPRDIDRIVVAKGPGSYTGLRVAVATAKTLAYSLGCEIVGISSLRSLVPEGLGGTVVPVINARRNHVYAGFYVDGDPVREDTYIDFEDLLQDLSLVEGEIYLVGEIAAFQEQIEASPLHLHAIETLPSALDLAMLGQTLPTEDVLSFEPSYLKRVEAEEKWLESHEEGTQPYIQRL
ncbi:tRNA (adenosine(37)-N6)-threonylcarbamoyltransferase complex dimerization subunit type 1 TsaB [Streptococcus sp. DD13]|uniref:tRNA (adenosine(37)-N6)-threonylcarbamoyltransferase complex dimerization subunit type 1 TsaB n=1 Tax=Streptococcus sp. DD13 TaxID=1777881 RepID=UPI000792E594|nr:tRNA (adenosine(37)-N6)-threonylcarbamoyltransferase complex dimerization subunit type 1 TsaB [Streptococcus sp. DD13]KXT77989.1 Inactive metal-dependent protease, putative molecular chaperone [Streptococcus sp. DD13]